MSVKAQGLVWDLECPKKYGEIEFKPNHKYVLIAYADHADHNGKNIYPAVSTIARKTGMEPRTVQRLTHGLRDIGLLVPDGVGPRGTLRWRLPYSERGDKLSPVNLSPPERGDKIEESLGDIPSGDIPSGDNLSPELKEPEQVIKSISNNMVNVWDGIKEKVKTLFKKVEYETWILGTEAMSTEDGTLVVATGNTASKTWLDKNLKSKAQEALGVYVKFVTLAEIGLEE